MAFARLLSRQKCGCHLSRVLTGSLSKALAGVGGFVACGEESGQRIYRDSSEYAFSCAVSHLCVFVASEAAKRIGTQDWSSRIGKIKEGIMCLQDKLALVNLSLVSLTGPLAVIRVASQDAMEVLSMALHKAKICFNPVAFPAVPKGDFRIRCCVTAAHSRYEIEELGNALCLAMGYKL
jgi:7-keto-8-aminopelargonate synthetase-like enzyme